jgi:hypothetical protein
VRGRRLAVAAVAAVAFVTVSVVLARWLNEENRERDAILELVRAEARGDAAAVARRLERCAPDPRCRARVAAIVARVRRPGEVKILRLDSGTSYALGSKTGTTRVAWGVVDRGLPVVQCVVVRRKGSLLAGHSITLRRLSRPIGRESSC